jgi:phenylpropionate dioxygenase-like ring-hydroxylating dioxygenase large terminal subunit
VHGNWKLIVDAFLDGYHIRHLHRDTIYRFFVDSLAEAEPAGPHIRALTARRPLLEADPAAFDSVDLRQLATPSYTIFPSTTMVLHPDFLSVIYATPLAPNRTRFDHTMLIADPPRTDTESEHWARSFALIDEGVFAREDIAAVEAMQRGVESGANRTLLFGELEYAALWFHERLDEACRTGSDFRSV